MGRWKPGQSGNPAGRPKGSGFASAIGKATNSGEKLWRFALDVLEGRIKQEVFWNGKVTEFAPSIRDRLAAVEYLTERMIGKPTEYVPDDDAESEHIPIPSDAELEGREVN